MTSPMNSGPESPYGGPMDTGPAETTAPAVTTAGTAAGAAGNAVGAVAGAREGHVTGPEPCQLAGRGRWDRSAGSDRTSREAEARKDLPEWPE